MIRDNLFIHIPKTGGTTARSWLGRHATVQTDHILAADAKKEWPVHFFYTFMRNPYTRMVSLYESQFPRQEINHYHLPTEGADLTFEKYVQIIHDGQHDTDEHLAHWRPQTDWIFDSDDNLMVDYVGHTETLKNDAEEITRLIGVKKQWNYSLIHSNKSRWRHDHYKDYFNDDTRKKVEKYYEKDIGFLKVKF